MIVPLTVGAFGLAAVAYFTHGAIKRRTIFQRVLFTHGFRKEHEPSSNIIDFTITIQWPEARGIQYLQCFSKHNGDASTTIANIRCFETTGARSRIVPMMRIDEIQMTVIGVRFDKLQLPKICVCPREFSSHFRLWAEARYELKTRDDDFDRIFSVLGKHNENIDDVLSSDVRVALRENPNLILETGKNTMLFYQQGKILNELELQNALTVADRIRKALQSPAS